MSKFIKKNRFLVFLLLSVFILRIPSLFEPYWYGDEGVYLSLGLGIKKGLLLYRDIFDNKTPLIYLLAALSGPSLFWLRFMLMLSVLTSVYFFNRLSLLIFNSEKKPARITTVIFALLASIRLIEGNIANSEIFILLPTIAGFYYFFSRKRPILSGLILSSGILLKVPGVFDFLALLFFLLFFENKKKFFSLGKREILLSLGYFFPLFLVSAYFWTKGTFGIFFKSCFLQTMGYLSSWQTGEHAFSVGSLLRSELVIRAVIVFLVVLVMWFKRKKITPTAVFVFIWGSFALFAATLSGRPYPHYLIQFLPALALIIGLLFSNKIKKISIIFSAGLLLLTVITVAHYRFWAYPTFSYLKNFAEFSLGKKDKTAYFAYFDPKTPVIYRLAEFIRSNTSEEEKIFLWIDESSLYALSRRVPATPYVAAYHIIDFNRFAQVATTLEKNPPALIIVNQEVRPFPQLFLLLARHYFQADTDSGYSIFLKRRLN